MSEHSKTFDIDGAYFTTGELAKIAGIERGVADQWIHRGLIVPTRVERLTARARPLFSARAIFTAKLVRSLGDWFLTGPSGSSSIARASASAQAAEMIAGEDWAYAVARSADKPKPLELVFAIARVDQCWRWELLEVNNKYLGRPFGGKFPYIVVQASSLFLPVFRECRALYEDRTDNEPGHTRRARK